MTKPVEILVACGSGIATSAVAADAVKKLMEANDIPANVHKGVVHSIANQAKYMDIICTTANYKNDIGVPVIKVFGLISGIGKDKVEKQIVDTAKEVLAKQTEE